MSIGVTAELGRDDLFSSKRLPLSASSSLKSLTARDDLAGLRLKEFKDLIKRVRANPLANFQAVYRDGELLSIIHLQHSLLHSLTCFELSFINSGLAAGPDLVRYILYFIHQNALDYISLISDRELEDSLLPEPILTGPNVYRYDLAKDCLNPKQSRVISLADHYFVVRFNHKADALEELYVLPWGNKCPQVVKLQMQAVGLLDADGQVIKANGWSDLRPRLDPLQSQVEDELREYLQGQREVFTLPYELDAEAGDFQLKVWRELKQIPYGSYVSYEEIARRVVGPDLASKYGRAVGSACGANKLMLILPCHRVIGQRGDLRGFLTGVKTKAWLLDHEILRSVKQ